jgi:predicted site-specific integrase-resolvase
MRLSAYAKQMGVSYKTAFRWWKAGKLDAYQLDTGTVIVREPLASEVPTNVALYARVSSADQKEDVERQMQRLKDYAAARGYQVTKIVSELASGLSESRPKFLKLLTDASIGVIVVEQRDRATRFGLTYIEQLMQMQGRRLEVIFPSDTDNDLVDDFIAVITSMASRIYGRRTSKRRAEKIKQCVEHAMKAWVQEDEA